MGYFSGVNKVPKAQGRGSFLRDGKYVVNIRRNQIRIIRKTGQPNAIVDAVVTHVIDGTETSNKVGENIVVFFDLSRKPPTPAQAKAGELGDLTDNGVLGMSRAKAFVAECLGGDLVGVSDEQITEELMGKVFAPEKDDPDPVDFRGMSIGVEAKLNQKGTFTNVYWHALPEEEAAEPAPAGAAEPSDDIPF